MQKRLCRSFWRPQTGSRPASRKISCSPHRLQLHADAPSGSTKPYYITTPIFYPNAVPHIGHLYSLVTADIFARFSRLSEPDRPVVFLTGTDEHGLKIQKTAQERGVEPALLCDTLSQQFRRLTEAAHVSNTMFLRTTEPRHRRAVEHVWERLNAKGLIYKDDYEGWYSISDECFYTDSQVTKTKTPNGEVVIASETGSVVEWSREENYKFRLSAFRESLFAHFVRYEDSIFPSSRYSAILQSLSAPLEDLSISRPRSRLSWGIPVPNDPEHTIYVWFDALTIYLTGAGYPDKMQDGMNFSMIWPSDLQIIGKDILRFHAIYFPAILQALELPLPQKLLSHAHWTASQRKMSKSIGNVVDPFEAIELFGVDEVRFYLARVGGHFRDDVDWSSEQLRKHADEIRSLLGNFLLRITSKTIRSRIVAAPPIALSQILEQHATTSNEVSKHNVELVASLKTLAFRVKTRIDQVELAEALDNIILCLKQANGAMTHCAPWSQDPVDARISYVMFLEVLRVCGICLQPFIPRAAENLLDALHIPTSERTLRFAELNAGQVGPVVEGVKLFEVPRIKAV